MNKNYFVILGRMCLWSWQQHCLRRFEVTNFDMIPVEKQGYLLCFDCPRRITFNVTCSVATLIVLCSRKVSTLWTLQLFCYSPKSGSQVLLQRTITATSRHTSGWQTRSSNYDTPTTNSHSQTRDTHTHTHTHTHRERQRDRKNLSNCVRKNV